MVSIEVSLYLGKGAIVGLQLGVLPFLLSVEQLSREPFAIAIRMHRLLQNFYLLVRMTE